MEVATIVLSIRVVLPLPVPSEVVESVQTAGNVKVVVEMTADYLGILGCCAFGGTINRVSADKRQEVNATDASIL